MRVDIDVKTHSLLRFICQDENFSRWFFSGKVKIDEKQSKSICSEFMWRALVHWSIFIKHSLTWESLKYSFIRLMIVIHKCKHEIPSQSVWWIDEKHANVERKVPMQQTRYESPHIVRDVTGYKLAGIRGIVC